MTEYIDKAALYKQIADYEQERMKALFSEKNFNKPQAREKQGLLNSATIIKHMIADFPAAVVRPVEETDAVPVVRCKECKWFGSTGCAIKDNFVDHPTENDFCSLGQREEADA